MEDSNTDQLTFFHTQQQPSADAQRLNLLALSQVRGLGEASLKALLKHFSDLSSVWGAKPLELQEVLVDAGLKDSQNVVDQIVHKHRKFLDDAQRTLDSLERGGIKLLVVQDAEYPKQLLQTSDPPRWLFVEGDAGTLSIPNLIAVVGTRRPSDKGILLTRTISGWLARKGFGIVSGLAEGIDEVAHQTALDYGAPTIGILGTGICEVFPRSTVQLRKDIVKRGGAIVTEYFPRDRYSRSRFVRRNRIQAGLAYATVPVEAQARSGTAHTYRYALEYGRVTFGVERSSKPMENGILDLLRADNRPVFDLDSPESVRNLEELLKPVLKGAPSDQNESRLFEAVMREFKRVLAFYPVTEEELEELKTQIVEEWTRAERDGQSSNP